MSKIIKSAPVLGVRKLKAREGDQLFKKNKPSVPVSDDQGDKASFSPDLDNTVVSREGEPSDVESDVSRAAASNDVSEAAAVSSKNKAITKDTLEATSKEKPDDSIAGVENTRVRLPDTDFSNVIHHTSSDNEAKLTDKNSALVDENKALEQSVETLKAQVAELEAEKEAAYKDGLESIEKTLKKNFDNTYDEKLLRLESAVSIFENSANNTSELDEELVAEAVFTGVCRIIGSEYKKGSYFSESIVQAISSVRDKSNLILHVSPRDYEDYQLLEAEIKERAVLPDLSIVADPRIDLGGCIIQTDSGGWDARIETQLKKLKEALFDDAT